MTLLHLTAILSMLFLGAQAQHFFGPPAIGFGAGLISLRRRLPLATSIVSRRSSRSYSHQTFVQYTPKGVFGYRTQTYSETDHFYTPNNMNYYQPNQYHYHSTPWRYRWGRSAEEEPRDKRAADPKLAQISNLRDVPANTISKLAENVSIAYQPDVWTNDMIFKVGLEPVDLLGNPDNLQDQDDCSKRLLCELNAKKAGGESITENEEIIAASYGKSDSIDISAESLEFDIAAVLGRVGGAGRCEMSYRRCESSIPEMMRMIDIEVEELDTINSELADGNVDVNEIDRRLETEAKSVGEVTLAVLTRTTTTTLPPSTTKQSGSYWWIDISKTKTGGNL